MHRSVGEPVDGARWRALALLAAMSLSFSAAVAAAEAIEWRPQAGSRTATLPAAEGNWRVDVRVAGPRGVSVAVLAEQRRLMVDDLRLDGRRRPVERSFIVNVRRPHLDSLPENATGGTSVILRRSEERSATWDEALSIALDGPGALVAVRVESVDVPTLYLAGDSTVTDQASAGASWGQFLPRYFSDDIAVANHAHSGESLKSFVTGLRFAKLLSGLRAGDWVMIQFGHNDQKAQWPQTYVDAATTYRSWLRVYIDEIRRRGATPLLVTSPERRNFDTDGRIRATLADYAQAMREVAREQKIALVDLNAASIRFYEALGPAISPQAFADQGNDRTHHSEYGARQLARAVIEGLRGAGPALTAGLVTHIASDAGAFDADDPPPPTLGTTP